VRKYVTGGLIVLLLILEYLLAFTIPGALVALNILLIGAYLFLRFTKRPLGDDPMVRGGASVIALTLLLLLVYVLGFNAVPAQTKQQILSASAVERDEMVSATGMLAKRAELEQKMIERNLQAMETDPNPVLNARVDDYAYDLYKPYDAAFQSNVRANILMPVAKQYLELVGNINLDDYPTLDQKLALMQGLQAGNKVVRMHLNAISGFISVSRLIAMMLPLFLLYLIGVAWLYVRPQRHAGHKAGMAKREMGTLVGWVVVLAAVLLATGGTGANPFLGIALGVLGLRLALQVLFIIMAASGRQGFLGNPLVKAFSQLVSVFFLFYLVVSFVVMGPAGVNESMVNAMQKLSLFLYVLAGCFALGIVLASLSPRMRGTFSSAGFRAFGSALANVAKVVLGVIIIAVFASLGLATDNPKTMVPIYFVIFLLAFGGVLLNTWLQFKNKAVNPNVTVLVRKVVGILMLLFCLLIPVLSMQSLFPGFFARISENPKGTVEVTNNGKMVELSWKIDKAEDIQHYNIARGNGKEPAKDESPTTLNTYKIVPNNVVFSASDGKGLSFDRPYYYWFEMLSATDAPVFSDPFTYIPADARTKNLSEVFEQQKEGYVFITNDSLTVRLTWRTSNTAITGMNIYRGTSPDDLKATRVENDDNTWSTQVTTSDNIVRVNGDTPIAPAQDNTLRFTDAKDLQYGWNYYWVIEAVHEDGTQDVYAPFSYSPVNTAGAPTAEFELKTLTERFNVVKALLLALITALVMFLCGVGIWIINKFKDVNALLAILGYVVLVVVAAIPALLMMGVDSSYSSLGVAYYSAVFIAVLGWGGASLYFGGKHAAAKGR